MPKKKEENSPESIVVKLQYPIEWGSETISEVSLKRPKGKHLKGLTLSSDVILDQLINIASKISAHPPSVFDEMDATDLLRVTGEVGRFFDGGQETGNTA